MKIKYAFTLSEVLIALVVIGVIAAITVPALMNNINNNQYKSALKKNYAVISEAFRLAYGYDYDDFRDWNYSHTKEFTKEVYNKISKYLYHSKNCGYIYESGAECWADKTYAKNGQYSLGFNNGTWSGGQEGYSFLLNDGTVIIYDICAGNTMRNYLGIYDNLFENNANLCIYIDLNGKRGPNTFGKDMYAFGLIQKGIVPAGIDNKSQNCDNKNTNNNFDCTAKMLK